MLDKILLLWLLAVLPGAEAFTDIACFGEKKLDLLRRFCRRPIATARPRMIIWAIFRHSRRASLPALLRRLGRSADQDAGGSHRHRRQDIAPLLSEKGHERTYPHSLGLRRAPAPRHGAGRGGGKMQGDRRHSCAARHDADRGRRHLLTNWRRNSIVPQFLGCRHTWAYEFSMMRVLAAQAPTQPQREWI